MRDINEPLRVAYAAALLQVPSMPVYYQSLPNNLSPENYIVFRSINNNDASSKDSARLNTNITIEIHTKGNVGNQGLSADTIADTVFQLCYPDKHTNLTLSRGQILWTQLANDVTQDFRQGNQFGYISRFITFRHCIFVDIVNNNTSMTTQGQVFRLEYTAVGSEVGFISSTLIGKNIIDVNVDGVSYSEIITSGIPVDKQALFVSATGEIVIPQAMEPDEKVIVLYQLSNPFQVLRFQYTASGGEFTLTSGSLINKTVVGVSRDGVQASDILSSGTPVNKQALYETLTGSVTFAVALDPGEKIIILYQI